MSYHDLLVVFIGFHSDFIGLLVIFTGFDGDLTGCNSDFMGCDSDFLWDFMVICWQCGVIQILDMSCDSIDGERNW